MTENLGMFPGKRDEHKGRDSFPKPRSPSLWRKLPYHLYCFWGKPWGNKRKVLTTVLPRLSRAPWVHGLRGGESLEAIFVLHNRGSLWIADQKRDGYLLEARTITLSLGNMEFAVGTASLPVQMTESVMWKFGTHGQSFASMTIT